MSQVDVIEYVVSSLAEHQEDINLEEIRNDRTSILELRVHEDDLGKVIGKKGRIAKCLRVVLGACVNKERRNYHLEIID